jgi:predicted neuraminidase
MKPNRAAWIWIALTLALFTGLGWRDGWRTTPAPATQFVVPAPVAAATNVVPVCRDEFVDADSTEASAHVSSICELPDGRLAAVWYAGTREGARDIAIYFATRDADAAGGWSRPQRLVTRETATSETFRYVKKVGNPLLFSAGDGHLYLLYVSISIGGWSSSTLNFKQSNDGGQTWTPSRRPGLSPFFNISELVKNGPTPLADGGWVVPGYHELIGKFPELLWLRPGADGLEAVKTRAFGGRRAFQPALTPLDEQRALLLCRITAGAERRIHCSSTADGGQHWTAPQPLDLPNSDSGLDALRLADGRLLLAFNDTATGRDVLRFALSRDDGVTWQRAGTVIAETGAEFSYPFLLQTRDGMVHLTYTWKRRHIKHVACNVAWLESQVVAANAGEVRP